MAKAGKKILLVDDDASLRQSLAEQLQLHEEFDTRCGGQRGAGAWKRSSRNIST